MARGKTTCRMKANFVRHEFVKGSATKIYLKSSKIIHWQYFEIGKAPEKNFQKKTCKWPNSIL